MLCVELSYGVVLEISTSHKEGPRVCHELDLWPALQVQGHVKLSRPWLVMENY